MAVAARDGQRALTVPAIKAGATATIRRSRWPPVALDERFGGGEDQWPPAAQL